MRFNPFGKAVEEITLDDLRQLLEKERPTAIPRPNQVYFLRLGQISWSGSHHSNFRTALSIGS
jgi:hypothetical protein